ncbi:MAG: ABC transporter ATP-binding protein [Nitrospiraceae bacterium]|nr:ABC transporter ATP-binding protein [Nitrospiraceae bacterium]
MDNSNGTAFLELKNVNKTFNLSYGEVTALEHVSLTINKRELVALVGPSGSGKTTLLNIIGSLDRPSKGEVILEGTRIDTLSEEELVHFRREKFSFIFQDAKPLRMLNVLENTLLPFNFFKPKNRNGNIRNEGIEIIKSLGLGHRLYHMPSQLSGGEIQRVAIARALITHPAMILADEPTANLDRDNRLFVIETFRKLSKEKDIAIVLSTHDLEIANRADRIVHLKDGVFLKDEAIACPPCKV